MIKFFSVMTNVSTIIALLASVVFFIGILIKSQAVSDVDTFKNCDNQIKVCRISSIVFVFIYWFLVSGLPTRECIEGYNEISATCARLGCIWIVFAFVNVVISIIFGILKRGKDELEIMGKLRKSNFVMGAIFLVLAFILKVN